jgi:CubicO group peptidase (beta-lactamase class C family)
LRALEAQLRGTIASAQAEKRAPSIAAAVVRSGEIAWADAVGLASADDAEEATPDHQYRVGSITKTFTAVAVMQLRGEGKLQLDDPLDKHLDVPAHGALTIRRMLAHSSGLQREIPGEVWESLEFPSSTEELLAKVEEAELVLEPGERWHYSNLAYVLLGEVIAGLSGRRYEEYVEARILEPLGLRRTSFEPVAPYALGYSIDPYADVLHPEPLLLERSGGIAAAGALWSTVGDLCRWAAFLADPDPAVLEPGAVELMAGVQAMADPYRWQLASGLGLRLVRSGERIYCGHDGGTPGYLANVLASREEKIGAAVLTNAGARVAPAALSVELIDKLRELAPPEAEPWRPGEPPAEDVESVLGRWWSEGAEFVFRWRDGSLEAQWTEAPEWTPWARFEAIGDDRFRTVFGREHGELLRVVRDDEGVPVKLYWATYPMTRAPQVFGAENQRSPAKPAQTTKPA